MTERQLERIEVKGFTSIKFATVGLGRLNVLVGANGAGKSNFIQALAMLGRIVDSELNLFVGMNGGAGALLNSPGSAARIRPIHGNTRLVVAIGKPGSTRSLRPDPGPRWRPT